MRITLRLLHLPALATATVAVVTMAVITVAAWAWQADAPPPAIAHDGVVNLASQTPPEFAGGSIARGSLIRIRGWRLGPTAAATAEAPLNTTLAGMTVELRLGDKHVNALPLKVSENEIEAVVPSNAPLGRVEIVVSKNGDPSEPLPVNIVESSFGAFSVNGQGWGPGEIRNEAPGSERSNSVDFPARPGETITLAGTGLGPLEGGSDESPPPLAPVRSTVSITVGGRPVTRIRYAGRKGGLRDALAFDLPQDVPEGCYVPVFVKSAPGIVSNVVTVSISRDGKPCTDPGNWLPRVIVNARRSGVIALLNADVLLTEDRQQMDFDFDAGLAKFFSVAAAPVQMSPFYLFPPLNTCTSYTRAVHGSEILSAFASMEVAHGTALSAGSVINVRGGGGLRGIHLSPEAGKGFGSVLGGQSPFPGTPQSPLFLGPGEYELAGGGEGDVGSFTAAVPVAEPVRWTNRARIAQVDRSRGVQLEWIAARPEDVMVIDAINLDGRTGALGVSECLAPARPNHFTIPAGAFAIVPPSHPGEGLPLNLLSISEFPGVAPKAFSGPGLDRGVAFFFSTSARNVEYR